MPTPPVLPRLSATIAACAVVVCMLVSVTPAAAQDAPFTPADDVTLPANSGPQSVAVGDFNSDGKQDLAVTDFYRGSAHVRLGNGDGTFRDAGEFGNLSRPFAIVVGDFNSDGTEDLAVAASFGTYEAVLLGGRGNGTFQVIAFLDLPAVATSLAVGDFNGDGREDLAATSYTNVSVRLQDANGAFTAGPNIPFGPLPTSVMAGDFDGNGNEDLAVVLNDSPPRIGILPGKGDGNFDAVKPSSIPNISNALAVGDFNADGREDLATSIDSEQRVSVRLGKGDGTLSDDPPDILFGDRPRAIAVGDFDSDGREDLAITHGELGVEGRVSVRLGNGDGTFRDDGELAAGDVPLWVAIGDLNADGKEDLAVANLRSASVNVRLGSGTAPLSGNLLVNGGFEQGLGARLPTQSPAIPGWTTTGGMTFVRYNAVPHLGFPSWLDSARYQTGGLNLLWGGDSSGLGGITTATQMADVSGSAEAIDDGRATANLSAWLGGSLLYADNMRVTAEFLTAADEKVGELGIGPVTSDDRGNLTTLVRRSGSAPVPAGTRGIRVTVTSTDTDTLSSAIADNVTLTLDTRAPDVVTDPPPPPPALEFGPDTKVTVRLAARRIGAKGPIRVLVSNGNAFGVTGALSGRTATAIGAGSKPAKLTARRFTVGATSRTTVRLALSKPLRRELRRRHKLAVRLSAIVEDPAGHRRTVPKRVVLRLKAPAKRR